MVAVLVVAHKFASLLVVVNDAWHFDDHSDNDVVDVLTALAEEVGAKVAPPPAGGPPPLYSTNPANLPAPTGTPSVPR